MKKRLLSLVLCLVMVFALFPTFAAPAMAADANGITNPDPAKDASKKLNLTKELTPGTEQGSYDLNLESWSTGEVHAYTEKIPTDFVVVVDQSGSMAGEKGTDMPTGEPQVRNNVNLETVAAGAYYYKAADGNYYRVYGVKDYLFRYYPANTWYVGDILDRVGADRNWFQGETEQSFNYDNQFYWKEGNAYRPIKLTIAGKALTYYNKFSYVNGAGETITFDRDNEQYGKIVYKNLLGKFGWGPTIEDDEWGYDAIDGFVRGVYRDKNAYTFSEVNVLWGAIHIDTGMLVNYPMYDRNVGYTKLCYRDVNGDVYEVPSNQNGGQSSWEYCQVVNDQVQAITTNDGSTRPTYSGLYTFPTTTTRLAALKAALTEFADAVSKETDSFGPVDNRVSIVGFSSTNRSVVHDPSGSPNYSNYNYNTELLTHTERDISSGSTNGWQKNTCDGSVSEYYGKALVGATNGTVGTVNPKIERAIDAITANGGTQPEDGLNMAYQILTNRESDQSTWVDGHDLTKEYQIRSGVDKDNFVDRNTVVIFFTDGQPGNLDMSNQYLEANEVVAQASAIKGYKDTTIFSIGVFGESDANPLTYDARNDWTKNNSGQNVQVKDIDTKLWSYLGGWMETHYANGTNFCLRRQWRPSNADYTEQPNDTIFDYMSVVSSNYPDAENFIAPAWLTGNYVPANDYVGATDGVRHIDTHVTENGQLVNKYYRMASNQDTLVAAFLAAVTMNNEETGTPVKINSTAVLQDKVNLDDFDTTNAAATAKVVDMSGNVDSQLTGQLSMDGTNLAQGIVKVSGFDYSKNFVVNGVGKKVVVTITGLTPKKATGTLYSNKDVKDAENNDLFGAGLYGNGMDRPVVQIASPTLVIPGGKDKTYIIDFNASMKVADGAKKLGKTTGTNGDFNVANNEATYKLKGGMSGTTFTASYSGVDTAMVYGVPVGSAANTAVAWNKITTVPASSVYIDDDFASTITVGDGSGYNAQITSATSVTTDADKLDGNYTIQFHGSRIDVYCTTDANAAAVTARVKNDATGKYVKSLVVSNKFEDETYGTLYNVPTISVDCGSVGDYTLELTVKGTANYRFDGVRIYDPVANDNYTGEAASEANATYLKVREQMLSSTVIADINQYFKDKKAYDEAEDKTGMTEPVIPASAQNVQGVMFYMDKGASTVADNDPLKNMKVAAEYGNYGPKNEIYLKKGEGLSFSIQNTPDDMKAWIGLSAPQGNEKAANANINVSVTINNVPIDTPLNLNAVDMYYLLHDATNGAVKMGDTIKIQNNGDALISVTNVKVTGSTKGNPGLDASVLSVADAGTAASVLSVDDGLPYLAVTAQEVKTLNAPAQAEDPQPTADPEPTPTQPSIAEWISNLFSSFVNALFGSIARLFGN
ncbi:MAG: hypothetical protein IJH52_08185 [Oscillospiraceae bacterium]|nr:hypothetical protein [Oscillospiraceae bacterium]